MIRLALLLAFWAGAASALELAVPGASLVRTETSPAATIRLPDAPWAPDRPVAPVEGSIRRSVYTLANSSRTTLQLIEPLRAELADAGYAEAFACADAECGGFDFRFQLDLIGEPYMHVDLGNYRYLLMVHPGAEPHAVSLVASAAGRTGFLHVTEVSRAEFPQAEPETEPDPAAPPAALVAAPSAPDPGDLVTRLTETGRFVLADLDFGTGSADLGPGPYASLATLAGWLSANPSARIVLVGHTDAEGSLDANTALSRRRAAAVADRLVGTHGASPAQIQSDGAGFLAPLATNLTEAGRTANRRVEVVLLARD